ncbi:MAG: preprotein translocase subunit SecG [Acidobacteriia bacterium]|nr:preprotein translocase subunit SecG [Terriglobia bacterium]
MLLNYIIVALHVLVCFVLILVVLLQSGKGADLAGAFGGGGTQTAFGSRGPASFLSKATTVAAVVFMLTSIMLSGVGGGATSKSILDATKGTAAPVSKAPPRPAAKSDVKVLTPEEIKKRQEEIESKQKQAPAKTPEQPVTPASQQAPVPVKK